MIRSRTLSLAALALAGTAAWAWPQSPDAPRTAPSGGAANVETRTDLRTVPDLVISGGNGVLSEGQVVVSEDVRITEGLIGIEAPPPTENLLFEAAEPVTGAVRAIRVDNGSQDVLWSTAPPAYVGIPNHRLVHRPQAFTAVRSLRLSPEEMEQQREIRKWTDVLHSDQPAEEKEKARKALSGLLDQQFSRDLERREKEVAQLEERVKKLRTQVEKRKEAKEKIIDLRLDTIEQEAQGLGFPEGAPRHTSSAPAQPGQPFTINLAPPPPPPGAQTW